MKARKARRSVVVVLSNSTTWTRGPTVGFDRMTPNDNIRLAKRMDLRNAVFYDVANAMIESAGDSHRRRCVIVARARFIGAS